MSITSQKEAHSVSACTLIPGAYQLTSILLAVPCPGDMGPTHLHRDVPLAPHRGIDPTVASGAQQRACTGHAKACCNTRTVTSG